MGEPIRDKPLTTTVTPAKRSLEIDDPFQPYKVERFDDGLRYDTLQVHAGHRPDRETHARAVPIYNSVSSAKSFIFTDSAHAKRVCAMEGAGYFYSRISNVRSLREQIARSNGLHTLLPRLGISIRWAKKETREEFEKHIDDKTKMLFVETIGNPRCSIPDLKELGELAHENNVPFVVDNTFGACGIWCKPIDFGADIILHSATKWMGGHGTTVGGVIIDCGTFDWGKAGERFPRMIKKEGPMSFSYWKAFGNITFAMAMRIDILMEVGSTLAPASAQQLLIGMETLSLRCEKHAKNTIEIARFLEAHPRVAWVNYPGLEKNQYYENAQKYLKNGYGGVLAFGPKGGDVASKMLMNYVRVISHQTNVGDSKTLATHPWNSTHVIMPEKDRREAGITPAFIRFSVGTEDVRDIIEDLDQALAKLPDDIVNAHDEKLEAKLTSNGDHPTVIEAAVCEKVDFTDADVSLSKQNVPMGRQTDVGNW
ncbi:Homocysteine synthase [Colletotrichum sp. SAR11_59]|nr:Homocysteine synthase [Colletotrichum sp. SAR11_59]